MERQKTSFLVHSVACAGTEAHLAACPLEFRKPNGTLPCRGGTAAVVGCVPGPLFLHSSSGRKKKPKTSVSPTGKTRAFFSVAVPETGSRCGSASLWAG